MAMRGSQGQGSESPKASEGLAWKFQNVTSAVSHANCQNSPDSRAEGSTEFAGSSNLCALTCAHPTIPPHHAQRLTLLLLSF